MKNAERRIKSAISVQSMYQPREMDPKLRTQLVEYLKFIGKRETGYNNYRKYKKPPKEFRESYNINHPELSKGQKTYLYEACRTYSIADMKEHKKQQYVNLLKKRKAIGFELDIIKRNLIKNFNLN